MSQSFLTNFGSVCRIFELLGYDYLNMIQQGFREIVVFSKIIDVDFFLELHF